MNLILYITNQCNLNCSYCFVDKSEEVMKIQTYKKIFEEYKEKINSITFFGGEPLLQFELIKQIIEYNEKNNYRYNYIINTNGINIDNNIIELCKKNNILLNISLDGNKKSNSKNRFDAKIFKLVERNIKAIKKEGIQFIINYVITTNNIKYITESIKYFLNNDFMDICFLIDYDAIWSKKHIEELRKQLEKSIPIMLKAKNEDFIKIYPIYNKINHIIEEKDSIKCNFGNDNMVVYCDGKKYPCISFAKNNDYEIIGKESIFTNICNVEKCKECEHKNICDNNCMCKFCYSNKKSEIDVNCECEKIFIDIAKRIVNKILNHELINMQ